MEASCGWLSTRRPGTEARSANKTAGRCPYNEVLETVVEVLRERGREIFRQVEATNRRNTGSIPRFVNEDLAEKIRRRRGLTFATGS